MRWLMLFMSAFRFPTTMLELTEVCLQGGDRETAERFRECEFGQYFD